MMLQNIIQMDPLVSGTSSSASSSDSSLSRVLSNFFYTTTTTTSSNSRNTGSSLSLPSDPVEENQPYDIYRRARWTAKIGSAAFVYGCTVWLSEYTAYLSYHEPRAEKKKDNYSGITTFQFNGP